MAQNNIYDIWLGVRLSVKATDSLQAERKADEWLTNAIHNGQPEVGVTSTEPPINLVDVAVRLLNQQGEEARRVERERKAARLAKPE